MRGGRQVHPDEEMPALHVRRQRIELDRKKTDGRYEWFVSALRPLCCRVESCGFG
jgi:hypothetical protein